MIFNKIFKNDMYTFFKVYLTMNSDNIFNTLLDYKYLKKNDNQFLLLNNLILLFNIVEAELYGIHKHLLKLLNKIKTIFLNYLFFSYI